MKFDSLFTIYVFLYQNLNIYVGDMTEFVTFIYVFLYQNLNRQYRRIIGIKGLDLCISILEFK